MTKKNGFTLPEILVVIGIIAILVLIAVPSFRAYRPSLQLSGAVRELITDLRYAQQSAVAQQIDHAVYFLLSEDKYQIISSGPPEEVLQEKQLPGEVSFQQIAGLTDDRATFNPYGALKNDAGSVTLINSKSETATVDIRPSGFVKIVK